MTINNIFLCPTCRVTKLSFNTNSLWCKTCNIKYPQKDNISYLLPDKKIDGDYVKNWDNVYKEGLKGDFSRGIDKLISALTRSLSNMDELLTLYPLIQLAINHNIRDARVLELGCGTGAFGLLIKKLGIAKEITLVDISVPAIKTAQTIFSKMGESADFVIADATSLPFQDNSFDMVFSTGLIEHFSQNDQKAVVEEHARVSRNVLLQFPQDTVSYWLQRSAITILNKGKWPFGYEKPLTIQGVSKMLPNHKIVARSYHDSITGLVYKLSFKYPFLKPGKDKNIFNKLMATDSVLLMEKLPLKT